MARNGFLGDTPLAKLMISHGVTCQELAEAAGLSEQAVRFLARGGHPSKPYRWTPYTLARISVALKVNPRVLAPELFTENIQANLREG